MCLKEKMDKINTQVRNFNTVVVTMQMKKIKNTISEINFSMGITAGYVAERPKNLARL